MRVSVVLFLAVSALPPAAAAQRHSHPRFESYQAVGQPVPATPRTPPVPDDSSAGTGALIVGSLLTGMSTAVLSGYVASRFHGTPCEDCGLEEGLYGAAIGFGLGAAVGANLTNRGRGPLGTSAALGMAIGAVGAWAALKYEGAGILFAIPIAQIASAVAIEHGRRRGERPPPI